MKRLILISLLALRISACTRSASTPVPTGLPVNFPTIMPEDVARCAPEDLQTSSNSNPAGSTLFVGVTLTNQSSRPCSLANPASVKLLDQAGAQIMVQAEESPAGLTPPAPSMILINPGGLKIVSIVWQNYCKNLPADGLVLQIQLAENQQLDIPINAQPDESCQVETNPSSLSVTPYSDPP